MLLLSEIVGIISKNFLVSNQSGGGRTRENATDDVSWFLTLLAVIPLIVERWRVSVFTLYEPI